MMDKEAKLAGIHRPLWTAAGCGGSCAGPRVPAVRLAFDAPPVKVNGVTIAESDIARELQHHHASGLEEARAAAAQALIVRHLLLQHARKLQLAPVPQTDARGRREDDEEALIRQVLAHEVHPAMPTVEECRRVHARQRSSYPHGFEESRTSIHDRLMARAWLSAAAQYVARLVRGARIEGLDMPGGSV